LQDFGRNNIAKIIIYNGLELACSRHSESGTQAKNIVTERTRKTRGDWGERRGAFLSSHFLTLFLLQYSSLMYHYLNAGTGYLGAFERPQTCKDLQGIKKVQFLFWGMGTAGID